MGNTAKTLMRGMSKSRRGSPSVSLSALYKQSMYDAFFATLKAAAEVSDVEALDAARLISEPARRRAQRYATGGVIGAATAPVVTMAGNLAEAAARPGQRGAALAHAARTALARPQIAKDVARGVVTGAGVQAIREGVQRQQAKRVVTDYIGQQQQPKVAKQISKSKLRKIFAEDHAYYVSEPGDD